MRPYCSFVVAARNDDYGGDFLHRMQVFANALIASWEEHDLDAELVVVEWNPPEGRPRLKDALDWPESLEPGTVRIVEVPGEIHRCLLNSDRMPMFEYIAKNVGIRRAKGEFILATNPDILYSAELTRFLASRRLCTSRFYRIDRHDVAEPVPSGLPPAEQLKFCAKHVFRANTITGTVRLPSLPRRMLRLLVSALRYPRRLLAGAERHEAPRHGLHTNAAGDFFLMAREHWYEVRGYPEFTSHAFIDGYACHMAAALGLEQVLLETPLRIYHQEHDRSEHRRRPLTDYKQYLAHGKKMLQDGRPETFNREDWGLASEQLEERWVRP